MSGNPSETRSEASSGSAPATPSSSRESMWSKYLPVTISIVSLVAAGLSATAAWTSAEIAKESVRVNMMAFTNSQRPFVSMNKLDVRPEDGAEGYVRWRFTPTWSNSGNTPTRQLVVNLRCEFWDKSMLNESWRIVEPPKGTSRNLIGPKFDAQIGNCTLGDLAMRDILAGRKFMYMIGRADYEAAFSKQHYVTEFCLEIRLTGTLDEQGRVAKPLSVSSTSCDELNCADEECAQQRLLRKGKIATTTDANPVSPGSSSSKVE